MKLQLNKFLVASCFRLLGQVQVVRSPTLLLSFPVACGPVGPWCLQPEGKTQGCLSGGVVQNFIFTFRIFLNPFLSTLLIQFDKYLLIFLQFCPSLPRHGDITSSCYFSPQIYLTDLSKQSTLSQIFLFLQTSLSQEF